MAKERVFNPTDGPVVIDEHGHVLGGGEFGEVQGSALIDELLDQGRLVRPAAPEPKQGGKARPEPEE